MKFWYDVHYKGKYLDHIEVEADSEEKAIDEVWQKVTDNTNITPLGAKIGGGGK